MLYCGSRYNPWVKYALKYLPPAILSELLDKLTFYSTAELDACRIARAICEQKEIILLSERILPQKGAQEDHSKVRYFVFVILHEISHAYMNHKSPLLDNLSPEEVEIQEKEANQLALSWFNDHVKNTNNPRLKPLTLEEIEEVKKNNQRLMNETYERG